MRFFLKNQVSLLIPIIVACGIFFVLCVPPMTYAQEKQIIINKNVTKTTTRVVTLSLHAPDGTSKMKVSNNVFFTDAKWEVYAPTKKWTLPVGSGVKTVYVRFKDSKGNVEDNFYKDIIELDVPADMQVSVKIEEDDKIVSNRQVLLEIAYSKGIEKMFVSNSSEFTIFDAYTPTKNISWILPGGSGKKTVYVQFLDANGKTKTVSDTIEYKEPPGTLPAGTLMKAVGSSLYYLGFDGKIHPFLHSAVFHSWHENFNGLKIKNVSTVAIKQYSVGKPICIRGGTWIVRFQNFPQLYAVETGCRLFPLRSDVEARILYGPQWKDRIVTLSNLESGAYSTFDRGVHDPDKEVKDFDHDGLDADTESVYNTSDTLPDTDGDGLSDIEEVFAWFTDPAMPDTDGDGITDMEDVMKTYILSGEGTDMSDTYMYPSELILKDRNDGKYYMNYIDHLMYFLSNKTTSAAFTSNKLIERFIVPSSRFIPVLSRQGWHIKTNSSILPHPSIANTYGNLQAL